MFPFILQDMWHIPAAQEDCRVKSSTNSPNNLHMLSFICYTVVNAIHYKELLEVNYSIPSTQHSC